MEIGPMCQYSKRRLPGELAEKAAEKSHKSRLGKIVDVKREITGSI